MAGTIQRVIKNQNDWQEIMNALVDRANSNSDSWSDPSITGVTFLNGCTNNKNESFYTTYDLGDKRLVAFHWNIMCNNVPDNTSLMTDVAQVPNGLRPVNKEAHATFVAGTKAYSLGIYDDGRVEIDATGNIGNGSAPRFTMFYLANKAN